MKPVIKRGLALTAIAGASCATGLLAPASAAAGDPPRYILESVARPGNVLTALPYGPISLAPRDETPGQVWELAPSERGVNLVNRDSRECLTVQAPAPGIPLIGARCGARPGQDWFQVDDGSGSVRFDSFDGCLKSDYGRLITTGYCGDETSQWRLVPAP
ncbi:hypothetical protein KDL01_05955 [Actinospica durhamensis]|uniref:Ricin B lectin domain-containing protein n=1 Tax=Actinospica durhamensis TaxID=1508375 RepID=A0A941EKY8_9ACTN|nr:hypothetical protein [Actinospica durhamensis]MBR7832795.1 hypothetical protein [Actinospica durhamensis]